MPNQYVTLFLTDTHGKAWSESFYMQEDSLDRAFVWANGVYASARLDILAGGYRLTEVRASDTAVFRDSRADAYSVEEGAGRFNRALTTGWQAYDRLLVRMEAGSATRRPLELGGIPEGVLNQYGEYKPSMTWRTAFAAWQSTFLGGRPTADRRNIYLRRKNAPQAGGMLLKYPVTTLTLTGKQITLGMLHDNVILLAASVGDFVRLSSFRNTSGVNGVWQIAGITPNVPAPGVDAVLLSTRRHQPLYIAGVSTPGTISKLSTPFLVIDAAIPERGVRRKTGRPIDSAHGRSPNQNPA